MMDKFDSIDDRELNNPGFFERRDYFDRLFPIAMAKELLLIILIIIIERYANRSDTKKIEEKRMSEDNEDETKKKTFFSNDEMFKRTTTQRSMTVKLKTVKTSDLDMNSSAA